MADSAGERSQPAPLARPACLWALAAAAGVGVGVGTIYRGFADKSGVVAGVVMLRAAES